MVEGRRSLLRLGFAFRAQADPGDLDAGQFPAVTDGAVIPFPPTVLERDDLLVLPLFHYLARDGGPFNEWRAVSEVLPVAVKKDIGEEAFLADFRVEEVDINDVTLGNAVLSAARSNDCESHGLGKVGKSHMARRF